MAEKTLGQVAFETRYEQPVVWGNPGSEENESSWQAVADAVIAAHEARRWKPIKSASDGVALQVGVWLQNADKSKTWFVPIGIITKQQAIARGYTHWTPIPAPPKEASDAE
jgi:hypothetical protein